MTENGDEQQYSKHVRSIKPDYETIYVNPLPFSSNYGKTEPKAKESVYETPIPVLNEHSFRKAEKNTEYSKSNFPQLLKSTIQSSDAASTFSKAFKFPKKILSSDHFQFSKDSKRNSSGTSQNSDDDSIYVEAEDARFSASYRNPKLSNSSVSSEIITRTQMERQNHIPAGTNQNWERHDSLAAPGGIQQRNPSSIDLGDQMNEQTEATYLEFSNEDFLDDITNSNLASAATSDEAEVTSMGGKSSKKTNNQKNKAELPQSRSSVFNSNQYQVNLRKKKDSCGPQSSRPISMPPCEPPEPPQIGKRPLPPTPDFRRNSSTDSDTSAEYTNIDDRPNQKSPQRKSSIPPQPPPLPPAIVDEDNDVISTKHSLKSSKPPISPSRNWKNQNLDGTITSNNSKSYVSEEERPKKIHPIAQMLKEKKINQLYAGTEGQEPQTNTKSESINSPPVKIRDESKPTPKTPSKTSKKFSHPPPHPPSAHVKSSVTSMKPPIIPSKPSHSLEELRRRETIDCFVNVPKKPARSTDTRRSLQTSSPKKSTDNKSIKESSQKTFLKPTRMSTSQPEADQEISSQSDNAQSAFNKKRIGGYTLHKLQAQRLNNEGAKVPNDQSDLTVITREIAMRNSSIDNDPDTYHSIDDHRDEDPIMVNGKKVSSSTNDTASASNVDDVDGKGLPRKVLQKAHSTSSTPSKSPNVKAKPRPTVPPPPRPAATQPFQTKEAKRPPSRPPPPSKQKIAEAKVKRFISASNELTHPSSNHLHPLSSPIRQKDKFNGSKEKIPNSNKRSSESSEKEEETYYSAIPDMMASPGGKSISGKTKETSTQYTSALHSDDSSLTKVRRKVASKTSTLNNEKRRPQKEFASVSNTVSLMRSKINKYSKRGNEQTETPIPDPSNKMKNWREKPVDSFDDDDDDIESEGIYAGIDDDYPVENSGSTPHLTSVMTSYR